MTKTPKELTKEWKAGKLPAGWYYLKLENGEIELQNNCIGGFLMSCNNRVIQILASVPSYDEYKAMWNQILYLEKCISIYEQKEKQHTNDSIEYNKLEKENNNLRALLRECYKKADEALQEIQKDCEADEWTIYHYKNVQEFYNLLTRINAALNEIQANPADNIKIQESEE